MKEKQKLAERWNSADVFLFFASIIRSQSVHNFVFLLEILMTIISKVHNFFIFIILYLYTTFVTLLFFFN